MSDEQEAKRKLQGRSPPFPFIPLDRAIQRARDFDKHSRGHPVRIATAVSGWGYKPQSSGGLQTVAALKAFGLVSDTGSGEERKVQLTEFGRRLLRDPPAAVRRAMLQDAALRPKLIKECWTIWGADRPPDDDCRWTLMEERGFTEDAARTFLGVYDATIAYAGLRASDSMSAPDGDMGADVPEDAGEEGEVAEAPRGLVPAGRGSMANKLVPSMAFPRDEPVPGAATGASSVLAEGERELTTGILSKAGSSFRLIVSGRIGVKEIDRLIRKLEVDRDILAEEEEDEEAEPPVADEAAKHDPRSAL